MQIWGWEGWAGVAEEMESRKPISAPTTPSLSPAHRVDGGGLGWQETDNTGNALLF